MSKRSWNAFHVLALMIWLGGIPFAETGTFVTITLWTISLMFYVMGDNMNKKWDEI